MHMHTRATHRPCEMAPTPTCFLGAICRRIKPSWASRESAKVGVTASGD